jgi:hypothetical protein
MKSTTLVLALAIALSITACGSESSFPKATGKGTIRAINAIKTSPELAFKIEEVTLGNIDFRQASPRVEYDDLEYDFNFDVRLVGDLSNTRIATENLDVIADMDYIMLLSGSIASPTVTLWESEAREIDDSETVFEARFAHTADSLGSIDFYFAAEGVAPVLGEKVGTLSFGEILPPVDYEAGDYVLIATTSDDPSEILFQSNVQTFTAATQYTVSLFDAGQNTYAPFIAIAYAVGAGGGTLTIPDSNYPAVIEYVNGSLPLGSIDIYDDDMQTSRVVDDLAHMGVAPELTLMEGENTFYITPSDVNQPVLIESVLNFFLGFRVRSVAIGDTDTFRLVSFVADRRPVETHAKFQVFSSSINYDFLSMYAIEPDEVLDEQLPFLLSVASGDASRSVAFEAGSYDFYIRQFGETEVLSGPIRFDLALGDVVSTVIFDTVDPAILELQTIPNNP